MNYSSEHKPIKLNLDSKQLSEDESFFLLNHDINNPVAFNKATPYAANYIACDMELPAGENYNGGRYYSPITNETYSWTFNSNGINFIWRIDGNGECQIVWSGDPNCLPLSADPKFEITNWRADLDVDLLCNKVPGGKLKRLVWVDGSDNPIGSLDVEASIATNSFSTPFFDRCPDMCAALQLCVPEPERCLVGEWVPFASTDATLSNKMTDKGFKFIYRTVYYDQRASEWSDRSSLYYQNAKGCFDNGGFSRCIKFRIPIGNPLVEKFEFGFSDDGGQTWFLAETIEKYKKYNSSQQYWYERDLSEFVSSTFDDQDCTFEYTFCNDKQRQPISPLQISRELNPMPHSPQGLIRIKESLGFYNYLKGSCPIDKNEADKFDIQLNCTDDAIVSCNTEYAKVIVRAVIYNQSLARNVFIWRETGGDGVPDDTSESAWFSAVFTRLPLIPFDPVTYFTEPSYDQTFNDTTRGFIAYIEGGTSYWGQMEQWRSTPGFLLSNRKKVGVLSGMSASSVAGKRGGDISSGNFYYQEYTFIVPRGTKGFIRLVSHHQTNGIGDNQNTSTQVLGIMSNIQNYTGTTNLDAAITLSEKEIYFDTCAGDQDLTQAFIIGDFAAGATGLNSAGYFGYITDMNNQPVEGARIYHSSDLEATTDHNGYYGFYIFAGSSSSLPLGVYVEHNCSGNFTLFESFSATSDPGQTTETNYQITSLSYKDNFYADVTIPVKDCNDVPVPGIRVAISGSKYKVSDSNGLAHFKLRNYNSRMRRIVGVVMDKNNCFSIDCYNKCHPCMPSTASTLLEPCFLNTPDYTLPLLSKLNVTGITINKSGLKHGGTYAFGWVAEGDCGRLSAVNETKFISIPRVQDTGILSYCNFLFLANNISLPSWVKKIKIVRSANLNPYDLQWVVDKIERTSDSKIKLTIQSLNDYNAQFNFKTNTVYKYFAGDRVEFIRNGDGVIFNTKANGILNYLTLSPFNDQILSGVTDDANYFNQLIIADDGKLDGLVEGAIIELQTPSAIATEPAYYEICASIAVNDGQPEAQSGSFSTFDTYLVNRQIGKFPAQYFEHKAPSDFWGSISVNDTVSFLDDTGKVHFLNTFENERRYGRNITLNSSTQINYFGDLEKHFDGGQEDIVSLVLKDDKIGAGITVSNNFIFEVSDSLLRVGADNVIRAATADSLISNPQAKIRGEYGCSYEDIGSIFYGDGFFTYIDSKNSSLIVHDFQSAKITGTFVNNKGVTATYCSSYFRKRISEKENFNKTSPNVLDNLRYSTGTNKITQAVYLTLKSLRHPGTNNEKEVYAAQNETIIYNPINDTFLGFASFTPEGYGQINLKNDTGATMLAFQNSLPYIHPVMPEKYNEFFGIPVDWVIGISISKAPDKIKVPLAIELQSQTMFFGQRVSTEMSQFRSEIPPVKFKQHQNGKWNAAFLNNINSRGGLYNGENARGYRIDTVFVRDNTDNLKYGSIDNNKRTAYSELDKILIKFMLSEQSGFDSNL